VAQSREAVTPGGGGQVAAGRRAGVVGALMVLGAASLWASLGVFGRVLYRVGLTPLELASVRTSIGFLGLAVWMARSPGAVRIAWRDVPFFAVYGAICMALFAFLYFSTIGRTTVSVAVALLYTAPAFVVVLARAIYGEPLDRGRLGALALVLAGVFLVTGALHAVTTGQAVVSGAALVFGLGSGLTYALYTILGKWALRKYDAVCTVFWVLGFGALVLAVAAPPWTPMLRHPGAIPTMLALGIFPTLVAYLLYVASLRRLSAGTASMLATAEPVIATLLGSLLLDEALTAPQALGIALIVAAALLLARAQR